MHTFVSPILSFMAELRPNKTTKYVIEDLIEQAKRNPASKDELYLKVAQLVEADSYYLVMILTRTAPSTKAFRLAAAKLAQHYPIEPEPAALSASA